MKNHYLISRQFGNKQTKKRLEKALAKLPFKIEDQNSHTPLVLIRKYNRLPNSYRVTPLTEGECSFVSLESNVNSDRNKKSVIYWLDECKVARHYSFHLSTLQETPFSTPTDEEYNKRLRKYNKYSQINIKRKRGRPAGYKIKPERDKLIQEGYSLLEIGRKFNISLEGARQYIIRTGQYQVWKQKRPERKPYNQ